MLEAVLAFITANQVTLLAAALAISEVLASVPSIKANSIFQLVVNVLKAADKKDPA